MNAIERIRVALEVLQGTGADFLPEERGELSRACHPAAMAEVLTHIDAQQAQIERLRADAARYRWLRTQRREDNTVCAAYRPEDSVRFGYEVPSNGRLDALIDAAMKYETSESEGRNDYL